MSPTRARALVAEDDQSVRSFVRYVLEREGIALETAASGAEGLRALERELFDVVLLGVNLPGLSGMEVLSAGRGLQADAQFILMTEAGGVDVVVEAMKLGAFDYVAKPLGVQDLTRAVTRALRETELRREGARLRDGGAPPAAGRMIGRSAALRRVQELVARVAPTRATVLVTGERGTGKELVARAVHERSGRAGGAFVAVHCSALPGTLLESELFGCVRGAFAGDSAGRRGLFEEAHGGTLFLDEVETLPPATQVELLRALQDRSVQRPVSRRPVPVDVRLVAAGNLDLAAEVEAGRFREDLFYRLDIFPIRVPPLRERREDIPLLANHFRLRFAAENGVRPPGLGPDTLRRLMEHDWPGNVRELENFIERAVVMHAGARSLPFDPPPPRRRPARDTVDRAVREHWDLDRLEREYVHEILRETGGHQIRAAEILGIDRRTLYRKLKRWGPAGG